MKKLLFISAIAMLLVAAVPAAACPNCKAAVLEDLQGRQRSPEESLRYSRGMNYSVYFMIGSIYGTLAGVSLLILRAYRNYQPGTIPGQGPAASMSPDRPIA